MNGSQYVKYLQQQMGRVGQSGMKYLNPSMLDKVYAADKLSRGLQLDQIGSQRRMNQARLDSARTDTERDYDLQREAFEQNEDEIDDSHFFDWMGLGIGTVQGQLEAKRRRDVAEMVGRQTKAIESMVRK